MRGRGTVSTLRALAATAFAVSCAFAQNAAPLVASIDVYGSSVLDSAAIRSAFESDLVRYAALGIQALNDPNANHAELEAEARAIEAKVQAALGEGPPLAYFELSMTMDFGPPQQAHVTIDVVEKADEARRMPFRAAPTGAPRDPGGLSALWSEYQEKMFALALAGTPVRVDDDKCPALHCLAPFDLPELAPYLGRFDDGAREHEDALYAVAEDSSDAMQRANALFVLAHTRDAERLVAALGSAIYDPDGGVRNNAMRVLMMLAQRRPDLDFPVRDLIAALDFPSSSDRNKAAYTVAALADQPKYRDAIRADAVPAALRLLRLQKPNNHDPAYEILTKVSGEAFAERDYTAWERWAASR